MINLETEKSLALDAQERYDIIAMAMDAADDNGFINSFIFERALYVYAAIYLYPEHQESISKAAAQNLIKAWNILIENDFLINMVEEHEQVLEQLSKEANIWYEEYSDWAHSARGILEMIQEYSGNIVQGAASRLTSTAQETGVTELLEIAKDWGMDREALKSTPEPKTNIVEAESLFKTE